MLVMSNYDMGIFVFRQSLPLHPNQPYMLTTEGIALFRGKNLQYPVMYMHGDGAHT